MNQTNLTLVEVLLPFHRIDDFLFQAIESVKLSEGVQIVIIAVNDTGRILTARELGLDSTDKLLSTDSRGYINALAMAVGNSTSEYIAFLDSDDLMSPNRIYSQLEIMKKENLDLVSCGIIKVDSFGRSSRLSSLLGEVPNPVNRRDLWLIGSHGADSSLLVKGELLRNQWANHKTFESHFADYGWALSLPKETRLGHLNQPHYMYRSHANQISLKPTIGNGWDAIYPLWKRNAMIQFPFTKSYENLSSNVGLALAFPAAIPKLTSSEVSCLIIFIEELLCFLHDRSLLEFKAWKLTLSRRALIASRGRKLRYWKYLPGLLFSAMRILSSGIKLRKFARGSTQVDSTTSNLLGEKGR
jgi:glycosyltransferase involved in cell wall biosynthesis